MDTTFVISASFLFVRFIGGRIDQRFDPDQTFARSAQHPELEKGDGGDHLDERRNALPQHL
jgi:hypothetical protein